MRHCCGSSRGSGRTQCSSGTYNTPCAWNTKRCARRGVRFVCSTVLAVLCCAVLCSAVLCVSLRVLWLAPSSKKHELGIHCVSHCARSCPFPFSSFSSPLPSPLTLIAHPFLSFLSHASLPLFPPSSPLPLPFLLFPSSPYPRSFFPQVLAPPRASPSLRR